ncbi:MAG: efflux RND transporter periplasmic adaptor subunit [Desulfobacteraceae bacterium]|nr:efflux RND transporter periplasmic adaptor subunit [Desulfobacteraceae bacterium]
MSHELGSSLYKVKWILSVILMIAFTVFFVTQNLNGKEQGNPEAVHKHDTPGDTCYLCDPSLRDKGRLWCKEHDRYEDRCWLCHPDMKDENRPFCKEHNLYEDVCTFCNPGPKTKVDDSVEQSSIAQPVLFCNEHNVPENECGICQPQLATKLEPGQSMKVRFASKQSALNAGIRTARPKATMSSPNIDAFCQVGYDKNALAQITPLASGVIQRILVDIGFEVEAGNVLVEIHSPEIAEAKSHFLTAIVDHKVKELALKREEKLVKAKISSTRQYQEAMALNEVALLKRRTAHQTLLNYGFTANEIDEIKKSQDISSVLKVKAPFSGTLVAREAVVGEAINPGEALFMLADLTSMWLELSILSDQADFVEPGLDVEATFDSLDGVTAKGTLSWVATSIDEHSRTLKARAIVSNKERKMKAGMFGNAQLAIGKIEKTLRVPKDAVQRFEKNPYLFVKMDDDLYALQRVVLGNNISSEIDVIAGIQEGDQIVVAGTFTVMSEFLKSRLGAGCVDD